VETTETNHFHFLEIADEIFVLVIISRPIEFKVRKEHMKKNRKLKNNFLPSPPKAKSL